MNFQDLDIRLEPNKQRYSTICPKCSHLRKKKTDPCLTVNNEPDNRWFNCNHCGWSGNLEVMEKYDKVRKNSGMPANLNRKFSLEFTKYFKGRGLSPHTLTKARVYETEKGFVGFPFYEGQTLVNVKFLNRDPGAKRKWWQLKEEWGRKVCFWGMELLTLNDDPLRKEDNIIVITEGEWDCLTYREAGLRNILNVPQGAPSVKAKDFQKEFDYLKDPHFRRISKIVDLFYISTDEDGPGHLLMEQLALRLGKWRCKIIKYPKGYKDINEVLVGNKEKGLKPLGLDAVKECYEGAIPYPIQGIIRPSILTHELIDYREKGLEPGYSCGIKEVDFLFTMKRSHTSYWTGVPGMGKSVWMRWYLVQLVRTNPWMKWALFTPEQRPVTREYVKLAELLMGKKYQKGYPDSMADEEWSEAMNFIEKHFIIVAPDKGNFESFDGSITKTDVTKLQSICKYISFLAKTENIFGYLIDAYNKLDNDSPGYMSETKFIESQLDYLVDFNAYYKVHGAIIAHPTKLQKDRNGNYIMPSVYDIKGSSAWYEKADIAGVIHRYKFETLTEAETTQMEEDADDLKYKAKEITLTYLKIEKIRFEEIGTEGILRFDYLMYNNFRVNGKDKDYHLSHSKLNEGKILSDEQLQEMDLFAPPPDDEDLPF